ncbi:helix-turn-helix transcriptional regulator [Streptomyces sp. SID10853]|uniref:ScbR family autoregulator-binding transcription factor n=1 Tax=Streptomyces sp. SID10853 TaxID=2706028 RepID=UPI0013C008B1|nr:helix-turn-helix transcriptional regulator [Streptomyces sp. SID10853]
MAKQDRAIQTQRTILAAAASVFEERGFQAATITDILSTAGVTKGALYFHFQSKEDLAYGVMAAQGRHMGIVPPRACKTQEVVDTVLLQTYRLREDPMVRAGVRLAMDQYATELDRGVSFQDWGKGIATLLTQAKEQGELLPHITPSDTAELLVGAYAGVQSMSQAVSNYADLDHRTSVLLRHIMPNVVLSSVLTTIDLSSERGAVIYSEVRALSEEAEPAESRA